MFYELFLKPFFFRLNPENAHELSKGLLEFGSKIPLFFKTLQSLTEYKSSRLLTKVAGIQFPNPLGMAAGFDKTGELYPFLSRMGFGHIEVGTVTGEEQPGNPKPRLFRYPEKEAIVNRMGFNNPGSEKMAATIAKQKKYAIRGINAGKTKLVDLENAPADYAKSFRLLANFGDYGVINISSPNTPGLRSLQGRKEFKNLFESIKNELGGTFPFPVFVKFAPDLSEEELLENLEECLIQKVDGVILTNTTLDKSSLEMENPEEGGLSGKPLREKANHFTKIAYQYLRGRIPIIGVGGIDSGAAALERIRSGASLVQIYTGYIFRGPFLPYEINKTIDDYLIQNGKSKLSEIVGEAVPTVK
ncbi:MAG: quinone-dependent dihydroorotate dehydrogenase [Leptospira sp.]|nr:quinone-dependent dihydroorotate dehydrogenase [Leptospira sp.]